MIIHDLNKLVSIETIEPKVSYKLRLLKQISFLGFVLQKGGYYQYDSFITDDLSKIKLESYEFYDSEKNQIMIKYKNIFNFVDGSKNCIYYNSREEALNHVDEIKKLTLNFIWNDLSVL